MSISKYILLITGLCLILACASKKQSNKKATTETLVNEKKENTIEEENTEETKEIVEKEAESKSEQKPSLQEVKEAYDQKVSNAFSSAANKPPVNKTDNSSKKMNETTQQTETKTSTSGGKMELNGEKKQTSESKLTKVDKVDNKANEHSFDSEPIVPKKPPVIIYKMKADYSNNIPVVLSADKKSIVRYPAPSDLFFEGKISRPTALANGYYLDNRGINENVAFTSYTYDDYLNLKKAPTAKDLFVVIIDNNPLIEIYQLKDVERNAETLNELIKAGKIGNDK